MLNTRNFKRFLVQQAHCPDANCSLNGSHHRSFGESHNLGWHGWRARAPPHCDWRQLGRDLAQQAGQRGAVGQLRAQVAQRQPGVPARRAKP